MMGRPDGNSRSRKVLALSGGAGAKTDNLFLITAPIDASSLSGMVTIALNAGLTAAYFDVWDGTVSTPLSLNNGVISSLPVTSWIGKQDIAATAMTVSSSAAAVMTEPATDGQNMHPFQITPKDGVATYIRFRHTAAATSSGTIEFRLAYTSQGPGGASPA